MPPLTRCSRDSKLVKLWKKASPCGINVEDHYPVGANVDGLHPRQSTSRGTQRLYIRLNTLHYLLSALQSLEKSLSLSPKIEPSSARTKQAPPQSTSSSSFSSFSSSSNFFDHAQSSAQSATQQVAEVAAYRLIFLDSSSVFESLYVDDVTNARIRPVLRILKQNLTLMCAILEDKVQAPAMREVMKASFEAFLMVLLAGGSARAFLRSDNEMIEEDFERLKRVFCTCGEGLIAEGVVEREAETVEGVIALLGQGTEQLMEEFSIVTCETSGILGLGGEGQKLPMPATTGRWHRSDANTILRVLCHRNDKAANQFLKRMFQLAKRR